MLVYDITNEESFKNVHGWYSDIKEVSDYIHNHDKFTTINFRFVVLQSSCSPQLIPLTA